MKIRVDAAEESTSELDDLRDSPRGLHRMIKRWKDKRVFESYRHQNEKNKDSLKGVLGEESRKNVREIS